MQENLGVSIHEEEYHLNDEETLLNENPEIFRKGPPIRPRETEPEDAEERYGKRLRFASNSMENENDENNIPKEWTTSNSMIEQEQDDPISNVHVQVDQNRTKDSSVSEARSSVLGRPIPISTTHVASSAHQLKITIW